jgi:GntR family transcriptional regulator
MASTRTRPLLTDVVQAELRRKIASGEFPLGSKLPNEDLLCDIFSVSKVTLREAVRGLVEDGTVVRRHGSGTYVTRRPTLRNSLETNFSYTRYLESSGIKAGKYLLGTRETTATEEVATLLDIATETKVTEIKRVRTADQRPAIYSIDLIPTDIVGAKINEKALTGSIYSLLASRGHVVEHGEALLAPVVANRERAEVLDVALRTPLQHVRQVDFDATGRPVMLSYEWHVPSVIELRVYRKGPGALAL